MNDLVKSDNSFTAVSISNNSRPLTYLQKGLMELMQHHIKENKPLRRDDIINKYVKLVWPHGIREYYTYHHTYDDVNKCWRGGTKRESIDHNHYHARTCAMQWFKSTIGACVLKGKMLVIPIIQIED